MRAGNRKCTSDPGRDRSSLLNKRIGSPPDGQLGQVSGSAVYEIGLAGGNFFGRPVDFALRINVT
jgi:hypothetical protein